MKVPLGFLLALTVTVSVIIFLGCSGDDGGTNSTIKTPGNPADLNYVLFKNVLVSTDVENADRVQDLIDLYHALVAHKSGNSTKSPAQEPVYHADSRYWYFEHTDTTYAGIEIGHDSIQFLHSGEVVQSPDSALLTEIKGGSFWLLLDTATAQGKCPLAPGDTLFTMHVTFDMTGQPGEIAAAGDVVISMTAITRGLPPGLTSDCDWSNNLTATANNLPVNLTLGQCPTSGQITYVGTSFMTCPAPAVSYGGTWNVIGTFGTGDLTWYFENETNFWDSDGYCFWHLE